MDRSPSGIISKYSPDIMKAKTFYTVTMIYSKRVTKQLVCFLSMNPEYSERIPVVVAL